MLNYQRVYGLLMFTVLAVPRIMDISIRGSWNSCEAYTMSDPMTQNYHSLHVLASQQCHYLPAIFFCFHGTLIL